MIPDGPQRFPEKSEPVTGLLFESKKNASKKIMPWAYFFNNFSAYIV